MHKKREKKKILRKTKRNVTFISLWNQFNESRFHSGADATPERVQVLVGMTVRSLDAQKYLLQTFFLCVKV